MQISTIKKAALYSRVSTNNQSNGLEAQVLALKNYCIKNSINDYILYSDENISGSKSSRPQLNKLIEDIEKDEISIVIVYSFSRFARSTKHLLSAADYFKAKGVEFVSLSEQVDTSTPIGNAFFTIISAISQLERELTGERVRNGLLNAKAKGKKIGRPKKRPSELIIELYKKGYSYRKIAQLIKFSHTCVAKEIHEFKCQQTLVHSVN